MNNLSQRISVFGGSFYNWRDYNTLPMMKPDCINTLFNNVPLTFPSLTFYHFLLHLYPFCRILSCQILRYSFLCFSVVEHQFLNSLLSPPLSVFISNRISKLRNPNPNFLLHGVFQGAPVMYSLSPFAHYIDLETFAPHFVHHLIFPDIVSPDSSQAGRNFGIDTNKQLTIATGQFTRYGQK